MDLRLTFAGCLIAGLWMGASLARENEDPKVTEKPNFVFILADDQAWNGTSVGMEANNSRSRSPNFRTPNLEALAADGMTFSQGYAAHPKCECSRAAILTGRSTSTLNATTKHASNWSAPASDALANALKRACSDYRTAHLGKWQWPSTPASMGYDISDGITQNSTGDSTDPMDPKLSMSLTRRAEEFMSQQAKEGHPFYLQISYYAVHPTAQALETTLKKYEGLRTAGGSRADRAKIAAMTDDLDTCIGSLRSKIKSLGIDKNTYIIYSSDNGGRTAYLAGGKLTLWEGGIRVPLIVAGPGVPKGVRCDVPVISYDILPTVLDLAAPGTGVPKGVEGGSWRTLWSKPEEAADAKVVRSIDRLVWHQPTEVEPAQSAMRKGDYKLFYEWGTNKSQLFDLSKDPREQHDLAAQMPELTQKLKEELVEHIKAGIGQDAVSALERGEQPGSKTPPRAKGSTKR